MHIKRRKQEKYVTYEFPAERKQLTKKIHLITTLEANIDCWFIFNIMFS